MDIDAQRKIAAILRVLAESARPLGSMRIARDLARRGIDLGQRMVRYYLDETDRHGFTENLGRPGRRITDRGRRELEAAVAVDRVGFVSARVDDLAYRLTFDLHSRTGTIILNLSTVATNHVPRARRILRQVLKGRLGMGRFLVESGARTKFEGRVVPSGRTAIGTVCSVTLNGVLYSQGIPMVSRFGGLLDMRAGRPVRFSQLIHYDGTTMDPIEIFIKGKMTGVRETMRTGTGTIGASFREIPVAALDDAVRVFRELDRIGLGGVLLVGEPGRPVLDVPVSEGRVGIVVAAGLNPVAAVEEAGISTESHAMAILYDFSGLSSI